MLPVTEAIGDDLDDVHWCIAEVELPSPASEGVRLLIPEGVREGLEKRDPQQKLEKWLSFPNRKGVTYTHATTG